MNNDVKVSPRELRRMSFFFSLLILMGLISFLDNIMDNVYDKCFIEHSVVEGTVSSFTTDSVFVDINWLVDYEHSKTFTEDDILDMKMYINNVMKNDLTFLLSTISHKEYLILKKDKRTLEGKGSKIIIFN